MNGAILRLNRAIGRVTDAEDDGGGGYGGDQGRAQAATMEFEIFHWRVFLSKVVAKAVVFSRLASAFEEFSWKRGTKLMATVTASLPLSVKSMLKLARSEATMVAWPLTVR